MNATRYRFSIQDDFPFHKVAPDRLDKEIRDSDIVIAIDHITTGADGDEDNCDVWFKDELDNDGKVILYGNTSPATTGSIIGDHSGEPLPATSEPVEVTNHAGVDSLNRTITVPEPETDRQMVNIVSHNFCDKCTWWQNAESVSDETLVDSGDGLTFTSDNERWIDLTHGRFYLEDRVPDQGDYIPVVKVDGVTKVEKPPFNLPGSYDYTVDYTNGKVVFDSAQTGTVTASYHYGSNSLFSVRPSSGKVLWVRDSEVQFSIDIIMTSTINFQGWAYNPADPPNKAPVTQTTNYKTLRNFVEEAKGVYPPVPAVGGALRGMIQEHVVFPFKYSQVKTLYSSMGVEIRVWMDEDIEFEGEFGTATFYCSSYDEES